MRIGLVGYDDPGWGLPSPAQQEEIRRIMAGAPEGGAAPRSGTATGAPVPTEDVTPAPGEDSLVREARIDDGPVMPG